MFNQITIGPLTAILFLSSVFVCRAADSAAGRWEGSVRIPGREIKLIVDLDQGEAGAWRGSIIVPGFDVKGAPLSDVSVQGSDLTFAVKNALSDTQGAPTTIKAHLTADGKLSGAFTEGGNTAPLTLTRTGPPQVEVPPKSTAIAPELAGTWKGQYELFGYPRHVTVKFSAKPGGEAAVEFVVVGKKTTNVPIDLITQEGDLLTLDAHEFGMSYEGRFDKAGGEIKGAFLQGPMEIPLVLKRSTEEAK
jgi:hypothetical protein